ncbi:MAG: hypothetical protein PVJ15_07070 [Gammaproteobacteria bacterium]
MGITVKIQLYTLAALPVDYLTRQEALLERMRVDEGALNPYQGVFITGVRAYQQHAYLELLRWTYGRAVAQQVAVYQHRLLEFTTGRGRCVEQALGLIEGALDTQAVSATTREGEIKIPIEMNVALALLLGLPESPDFAATAARRAENVARMQPEIDWRLAHCLMCAREEIGSTFLPMVARLEGAAGGEAAAGFLNE